jgi:radical SAM/Cys-rich protein
MAISTSVTPFTNKLGQTLTKKTITTLQINLGKKCNLACTHCHVEAGPNRTEELTPEVCEQILTIIDRFPQLTTVDLTGGAPEMNYGFREIVEKARSLDKNVLVRSNLTIMLEPGFEDLPSYFAKHKLKVIASLPCYLQDNVDQQRGSGVYDRSIQAIRLLNQFGYGTDPALELDLVYNPPLPKSTQFNLTPDQGTLEQDYKEFLAAQFQISFNHLFTITNLPIGRTKQYLQRHQLEQPYLQFLETHYNPSTLDHLMCRDQLSIDYQGRVYDCDFNQMELLPAYTDHQEPLTLTKLLELDSLDVIAEINLANYCYGCTAGSGSSCGGALV